MKRRVIACLYAVCCTALLAGCAATSEPRSPFHQYLHDHGLE